MRGGGTLRISREGRRAWAFSCFVCYVEFAAAKTSRPALCRLSSVWVDVNTGMLGGVVCVRC